MILIEMGSVDSLIIPINGVLHECLKFTKNCVYNIIYDHMSRAREEFSEQYKD